MIWLALAYTAAILEVSSINTQCTAIIFIRLLLSTTNFPKAKLSSTFLSPIFWKKFKDSSTTTRKYSKTFHQHPKIFKDFFACKFVLAANHQLYSGKIQRLFGQPTAAINSSNQQQSTAATNSSNQQQQPTAAINSSHQQQQSTAATSSSNQQQPPAAAINSSHQQQQSTAATSSSNQQQPPAAAINSSNQQQQSTAATKSSIRQQQSFAATTSFRPTSITSTIHDDLR